MLDLQNISLSIDHHGEKRRLLDRISVKYARGHFGAIIGPSGCGKSTLLKVISGIAHGEEEGGIYWEGRDIQQADFAPSEIGFVPQFSIAHEELTVRECVTYSRRLRLADESSTALRESVESILAEVSMMEFADRQVRVLSGGQRRRLALAMELTSKPTMLLCDEVTSGLDPQSEDEIVRLLYGLSRFEGRLVLSVTHSLRHLNYYDSVTVLYGGVVAYHGPAEYLTYYFQCEDPQDLYVELARREPAEWAEAWEQNRITFNLEERAAEDISPELQEPVTRPAVANTPGLLSQFLTLTGRRFRIFSRNKAQILLQAGLVFGFPILVAIFAWNGLPAIKDLSMGMNLNVVQQLVEAKDFLVQASKVGSLVSGIVMFQVILLTLMGANNAGREIAAERLIFEKEKLSGLNSLSYVASKFAFLMTLVVVQSAWMGLFVYFMCSFPGELATQLLFLLLVNAAMTFICLTISSWMNSAEQASLASIYLVGFQLPLSGAVLALPDWVGNLTRPFIAAYWSWSGILQTLRSERYYDIIQTVIQTQLSPPSLCLWVLCSHIIIGIFLTWLGCQRSRMD